MTLRSALITALAWAAALATVLYQRALLPLLVYLHSHVDLRKPQPSQASPSVSTPAETAALPPAKDPAAAPASPAIELQSLTCNQLKQLAGLSKSSRHSKRQLIHILSTQASSRDPLHLPAGA